MKCSVIMNIEEIKQALSKMVWTPTRIRGRGDEGLLMEFKSKNDKYSFLLLRGDDGAVGGTAVMSGPVIINLSNVLKEEIRDIVKNGNCVCGGSTTYHKSTCKIY